MSRSTKGDLQQVGDCGPTSNRVAREVKGGSEEKLVKAGGGSGGKGGFG